MVLLEVLKLRLALVASSIFFDAFAEPSKAVNVSVRKVTADVFRIRHLVDRYNFAIPFDALQPTGISSMSP